MEVAWSCVPPGEGSSSYYRNTFKIRRQEKERETPGAMKTSSRSEKEPIKAYVRIINFGQSTTFLFCFTWLILKPATTKFVSPIKHHCRDFSFAAIIYNIPRSVWRATVCSEIGKWTEIENDDWLFPSCFIIKRKCIDTYQLNLGLWELCMIFEGGA